MTSVAAVFLTSLLVVSQAAAQCDLPRPTAIAPISVQPLCGYRAGAIASNGEDAIGAWMTSRPGFSDISGTIAGGSMDVAGRLRDATQRTFSRAPAAPSIASDGTSFLLVYNDAGATWATLLAADGSVRKNVAIVTGPGLSRLQAWGNASVVWNGTDYVIVTDELRRDDTTIVSRVLATAVTRDGDVRATHVLAAEGRVAALSAGPSGRALAVWRSGGGVFGTLLTGVTPAATHRYAPSAGAFLAAAGDGSSFLLASLDPTTTTLKAQSLDADGAPAGAPLIVATSGASARIAAVHEGGGTYLLLWSSNGMAVASRILGNDIAPPFQIIAGGIFGATPTRAGTIVLTNNACGTVATALVPRGESRRADSYTVSLAGMQQSAAATAPTATGHQLFWYERRGETGDNRLFASHVRSGTVTPPLELTTGGIVFSADAAPFLGGSVVVWDEAPKVRLARFSPSGRQLGETVDVAAPSFTFRPVVSVRDDTILVLTSERTGIVPLFDVYATFLDKDLRVIDRVQLAAGEDAYYAEAGFDGGRWYASWVNVNRATDPPTLEHVSVDVAAGTRVVTALPEPLPSRVSAPGAEPMVLWTTSEELHAYFPHSARRVVIANPEGLAVDFRVERRGDAVDLYWSDIIESESRVVVHRATVSPDGAFATTPLLCLETTHFPTLVLRDGTISALALHDSRGGALSLHDARFKKRKRRAVD